MIVHGGSDQQDLLTNSVQVFDVSKRSWSKPITNYKTLPLDLHSIAFTSANQVYQSVKDLSAPISKYKPKPNEGLYIFGGRDENGNPSKRMWRYKILSSPWYLEDVEGMANGPSPRFGHCLAYLSTIDSLVVFGGEDGQQSFNDVFLFNVELNHWVDLRVNSKFRPVPRTRFSFAAICEQRSSRLFILGGMADNCFAGGTILCLEFEDGLFRKLEYDAKEQKSLASSLENNEVKIEPKRALERRPNAIKQKVKAFSKFSNYQPYPSEAIAISQANLSKNIK